MVVPTLGRSPLLAACLAALRRDGGEGVEICLVIQGGEGAEPLSSEIEAAADRLLRSPCNLGFAAATNLGVEACEGEVVGTVNDDVIVEPGWLASLRAALELDPAVAAVQGVNLRYLRPEIADGCGLTWNAAWQAVQIDHDRPPPPATASVREVFGVSATAALFRRAAVEAAARLPGEMFDPRLGSYYEDVDLACRLRANGRRALLVPEARALHAGSTTAHALGSVDRRLIYGNRYLVLAALLGRGFWHRLPRLVARDLADLAHDLGSGRGAGAAGILAGWGRALRLLPQFARRGRSEVPAAELARLREAA